MMPYLTEQYGNPSSLHTVGQLAAEALFSARKTMAECLNCDPKEIIFTGGGSEADNQALLTGAEIGARKGKKHIISTAFEHHAVLHTLKKLEKEGFEVTLLDVHENGMVSAQQVADAHAVAAHLVGIGRTDAFARGADLGAALGRFVSRIENAVGRQDQVGFLRNAELFGQVVAAGCERLGLLAEEDGVNDNAVADDVGFSALKYARRNRAEYVFLAVELQRVTGIGTALKTGDDLVGRRQHIHDFSLVIRITDGREQDLLFSCPLPELLILLRRHGEPAHVAGLFQHLHEVDFAGDCLMVLCQCQPKS